MKRPTNPNSASSTTSTKPHLTKSSASQIAAQSRSRQKKRSLEYGKLEVRNLLAAVFPAYADGDLTLGNAANDAPYALADTFKLESNPDSNKTVFLDFTGHFSTGNDWKHSINFPKYNTSGSVGSFTQSELIEIQKIFQAVAEDFLPLDVNVTTQDPGDAALRKSHSNDSEYGIRVLVTQHTSGFGNGTGGLAIRNSFMDNQDTPVFVFNKGIRDAAWTISHEVGHSLGLTHDGSSAGEYYSGHGSGATGWGPIMGGPFGKSLTQWSDGSYSDASNHENDLAVMTRSATGVQLKSDVVGNTFSSASNLSRNQETVFDWGVIENRNDKDFYQFTVSDAEARLTIKPFQGNGNLDVRAQLFSSNGDLVATSNPKDETFSVINKDLAAGTYFLSVEGIGKQGAYTDYGSLGFYSIEGTLASTTATQAIGEAKTINFVDSNWRTVQLNRTYANPVIIAGPASANHLAPGNVRIRNVTANSFQIRYDKWDYQSGTHPFESVGIFVVEAGRHELADGTQLVAGNGFVSNKPRKIGLGMQGANNPVVFSQIISNLDTTAVTTRLNNVRRGSFEIQLQEEELNDDIHRAEKFSYIAIEQVRSNVQDLLVETSEVIANDKLKQIDFQQEFQSKPVLLANMQTINGRDTATIRGKLLNGDFARIFVQEERSEDAELEHREEEVGFLAMTPGIIFAKSAAEAPEPIVDHDNDGHEHGDHDRHEEHEKLPFVIDGVIQEVADQDLFADLGKFVDAQDLAHFDSDSEIHQH